MKDDWRPVHDFVGFYEVSRAGAVRSIDRIIMRSNGQPQTVRGRILKATAHKVSGHLMVALSRPGHRVTAWVHRLVLEAFVGPCPPGFECRHFPDRDPTNNAATNLSWGTRAENVADMAVHGTTARGERMGSAKLTDQQVDLIRLRPDDLQAALAVEFNVSQSNISKIRAGLSRVRR